MEESKRSITCQEDLDSLFDAVAATTGRTAVMFTEVSFMGNATTVESEKEKIKPILSSQSGMQEALYGLIVFHTDGVYSGHGWLAVVDGRERYCWIIHTQEINWKRVKGICEVGVSPVLATIIGIT